MFYNTSDNYEYNDCVSKGACSVSPAISSMQEIMFVLLRQTAYYLIKLKGFGIINEKITKTLISQVALMDGLKDFTEAQVLNIFSSQYSKLIELRKEYLKICKEHEEQCKDVKNLLKLSSKTSLSEILKKGDKEYICKYKKLSISQKSNAEILTSVMKSVCVNIIYLYEYDNYCEYASDNVLEALNLFNSFKVDDSSIKKYIEILSKIDIELLKLLKRAQIEHYGDIDEITVSTSTDPNKAILVSGSNLSDLKDVLDFVKDTDVDVYTNGNLLIAHAFSSFHNYKNLKGHFGSSVFTTMLDFATFPGAILLTKNEAQNIEYLYRGRLFTTDDITPKGVVKIVNKNYEPLLKSAIQAKGFAKGQHRNPIKVGYNKDKLSSFLDVILKDDFKNLFIIGHSNLSMNMNDYFKRFFHLMPNKSFAISFSFDPKQENVLTINLVNDYPQIYAVLQKVFEKIPISSEKLAFFLTKCDVNSFSNIINLKNEGAKNIFLSDCPPNVINPSVLNSFIKLYNIFQITTPEEDLKKLQ